MICANLKMLVAHHAAELHVLTGTRRPNIAVARLEVADGRIVLVNADRAVSCHKWIAPRPDSTFTFAKAGELAYGVEADSTAPR